MLALFTFALKCIRSKAICLLCSISQTSRVFGTINNPRFAEFKETAILLLTTTRLHWNTNSVQIQLKSNSNPIQTQAFMSLHCIPTQTLMTANKSPNSSQGMKILVGFVNSCDASKIDLSKMNPLALTELSHDSFPDAKSLLFSNLTTSKKAFDEVLTRHRSTLRELVIQDVGLFGAYDEETRTFDPWNVAEFFFSLLLWLHDNCRLEKIVFEGDLRDGKQTLHFKSSQSPEGTLLSDIEEYVCHRGTQSYPFDSLSPYLLKLQQGKIEWDGFIAMIQGHKNSKVEIDLEYDDSVFPCYSRHNLPNIATAQEADGGESGSEADDDPYQLDASDDEEGYSMDELLQILQENERMDRHSYH